MEATVFNPIQLHLLKIFEHMNSEHELRELQQVLSEYYFKKVGEESARIVREKGWTPEKLEAMADEHFRTERVTPAYQRPPL
jgi:2-oxoglutarate dehydrogenase complex dehydrogenase (E1) component-like enzyme